MNPFLPLLLLMLGFLASAVVPMLIGWFFVPATDTVVRRCTQVYAAVVLTMMVMAVAMLLELALVGSSFVYIPVWLAGVALFGSMASAGLLRGLSIQKYKRWV